LHGQNPSVNLCLAPIRSSLGKQASRNEPQRVGRRRRTRLEHARAPLSNIGLPTHLRTTNTEHFSNECPVKRAPYGIGQRSKAGVLR
jgi:hypothetical protein